MHIYVLLGAIAKITMWGQLYQNSKISCINLLDLSGIKFNKCSDKSMGSKNMTDQRTKRLSDQPTDQPTDGHEGS